MLAVNKGTKAMYEVLKLGRIHSLSINCQLDLFDKMVKPTLLYGCEIWGLGTIEIIERVASFTVYISKHNLYTFCIINDNLDSLPNNNFDQNDRILFFYI
jgi:hypothetical protein